MSADRQTDLGTAVYKCENTVFVVKYMRGLLCCLAFVNVAQDMETDRKSYELSWAHEHKPECERCSTVVWVTWCSFIHPSKPGSFRAKHLHKLCTGLKIKLALLEKYCSPAHPLPTVIINRLCSKTWKDLAFRRFILKSCHVFFKFGDANAVQKVQ